MKLDTYSPHQVLESSILKMICETKMNSNILNEFELKINGFIDEWVDPSDPFIIWVEFEFRLNKS